MGEIRKPEEEKMTRKPMHVDAKFEERLKALQIKIMKKQGIKPSLRELTAQLPRFEEFNRIEERIIGNEDTSLELNFDRRRR
jgi:hypothetical protein